MSQSIPVWLSDCTGSLTWKSSTSDYEVQYIRLRKTSPHFSEFQFFHFGVTNRENMDPLFDSCTFSSDGERRNRHDYYRLGSRIWNLSGVVSSRFRARGHKVEIFISVLSLKTHGGKWDKCYQVWWWVITSKCYQDCEGLWEDVTNIESECWCTKIEYPLLVVTCNGVRPSWSWRSTPERESMRCCVIGASPFSVAKWSGEYPCSVCRSERDNTHKKNTLTLARAKHTQPYQNEGFNSLQR